MSNRTTHRKTLTAGGVTLEQNVVQNVDRVLNIQEDLVRAKTGTLTTRTDNDTGTLTMEASHGITTSAVVDVYWSGGARYGMTVGTVSGTSVPIDGGSGDNLPIATTAITAMVPLSFSVDVSGAGGAEALQHLFVSMGGAKGSLIFSDGSDTVRISFTQTDTVYEWRKNQPGPNTTDPLTAASCAATSFKVSHADGTATKTITVSMGFDG